MARHHDPEDRATVVPVILKPSDWKDTPFAKLQALPKNAKPVTKWDDKHEALLDTVKALRSLIKRMNEAPVTNQPQPPKPASDGTPITEAEATTFPSSQKKELQQLVISGQIEKAINQLIAWANSNNPDLHNDLILLMARWNRVVKDANMGLTTQETSEREKTKIDHALLEILKKI